MITYHTLRIMTAPPSTEIKNTCISPCQKNDGYVSSIKSSICRKKIYYRGSLGFPLHLFHTQTHTGNKQPSLKINITIQILNITWKMSNFHRLAQVGTSSNPVKFYLKDTLYEIYNDSYKPTNGWLYKCVFTKHARFLLQSKILPAVTGLAIFTLSANSFWVYSIMKAHFKFYHSE